MQLPDDPRLADPRVARQEDRLAFARRRAFEPVDQQRHLVLAADKARQPARASIEAALDRALGQHLPYPDRLGDALQLLRAQIVEDEGGADELPGQPADHDLVRSCQRFETRGEIWRLAGHRPRLATPGGVEVADDDGAGCDPDVHMKR